MEYRLLGPVEVVTSDGLALPGRVAALRRDVPAAEEALAAAIDVAEAAGAGWLSALARVVLADVRNEHGDRHAAEDLLQRVIDGSRGPVGGAGRVMFYRRIAGDPVAAAMVRLAPSVEQT